MDFLGFHGVSLGFPGFYRVLLGFTGFYWVLLGLTGFDWVWLGFTGFYWVLLGFTGLDGRDEGRNGDFASIQLIGSNGTVALVGKSAISGRRRDVLVPFPRQKKIYLYLSTFRGISFLFHSIFCISYISFRMISAVAHSYANQSS